MFNKRNVDRQGKRPGTDTQDTDTDTKNDDDTHTVLCKIKSAQKKHKSGLVAGKIKNEDGSEDRQVLHTYKGRMDLNLKDDQRATYTYDIDTPIGQDARTIQERNQAIGKAIASGELEDGVYRGLGATRQLVAKREGSIAAGKFTGRYGPVRGNQHVRSTLRIDYNPELCKDYFETGYCGWGDTCKFLHDRSDYKSGWQLEKEWEKEQKLKQRKLEKKMQKMLEKKKEKKNTNSEKNDDVDISDQDVTDSDEKSGSDDSDDSGDERLPFACLLCRKKWNDNSNPVVTICRHYFCEKCAFTHYAKSSKCAQCGKSTEGIFNSDHNLIDRITRSVVKSRDDLEKTK